MEDDDEYERRRLANIAENEALLRSLEIGGGLSGTASKAAPAAKSKKKKAAPKKATPAKTRKQPERARRVSSRLAGIEADSDVLKRKYEVSNQRTSERLAPPPDNSCTPHRKRHRTLKRQLSRPSERATSHTRWLSCSEPTPRKAPSQHCPTPSPSPRRP